MLELHDLGFSNSDIATRIGVNKSTIGCHMKSLCRTCDPYNMKKSPGCPKTFDLRMLCRAACGITSGQYPDTTALQREMFPDIHPTTVRRALCKIGLNGRVRRTKPFLSTTHKKARRIWAEEHHEWEVEAHWHNVVFSDECKFNLFGSDGRQYCRRRPGEEFLDRNVKKVVKHGGGSLMVWGCIM